MTKGVLQALADCLWVYGRHELVALTEQVAPRGGSRIDYDLEVDGEDVCLLETKSPSVMNYIGARLPQNGIELTWASHQTMVLKMLTKVSILLSSLTALAFKKYI